MAAKKTAKKAAKKGGSSGKVTKDKVITVRLDKEIDDYLRGKVGPESYAPYVRKLIREAKEREEKGL